jgi:hypothetical protein
VTLSCPQLHEALRVFMESSRVSSLPTVASAFLLPVINAAPTRETPPARIVRLEILSFMIDLTVGVALLGHEPGLCLTWFAPMAYNGWYKGRFNALYTLLRAFYFTTSISPALQDLSKKPLVGE